MRALRLWRCPRRHGHHEAGPARPLAQAHPRRAGTAPRGARPDRRPGAARAAVSRAECRGPGARCAAQLERAGRDEEEGARGAWVSPPPPHTHPPFHPYPSIYAMHPHPPHGWTWAKLLLQSNLLSGTVTVLGEGVYIYIYNI